MDKQKIIDVIPPQPFVDCRGLSVEDDYLASVRAALGLPDDTPEPLVGVIWRLQQRIEDLEERVEGEVSTA